MRPGSSAIRGVGLLASCLVVIGLAPPRGLGDEPQGGSRLTRLFRFGGGNPPGSASHNHPHDVPAAPGMTTTLPIFPTTPVSTPEAGGGTAPRISPQPRVSRPPTESDPILTRASVARSDGGGQFGMFLQVFADGTVIDGEGVHKLGGDVMRPLTEALRQGDLYRLKGHCGAPPTDFIEVSHVVLFERSYGKLRATSFSYSGNPQGCDPAVRKLHAAMEAIQGRISSPAPSGAEGTAGPAPVAGPSQGPMAPAGGRPVLELSPPGQ